MKSNGKGKPDMSTKRTYHGSARFIELGSLGAPFRSLINVDHITNIRFEQKIGNEEATYDDGGEMTAPPQQFLEGWHLVIVLAHGAGGQNIMFPDEQSAVACYNNVLDMIVGTGAPMSRMVKLKVTPEESKIEGLDGNPIDGNDDDQLHDELEIPVKDTRDPPLKPGEAIAMMPGESGAPPLTDEELDQLANPEIDVDGIAEAIKLGLGADDKPADDKSN